MNGRKFIRTGRMVYDIQPIIIGEMPSYLGNILRPYKVIVKQIVKETSTKFAVNGTQQTIICEIPVRTRPNVN